MVVVVPSIPVVGGPVPLAPVELPSFAVFTATAGLVESGCVLQLVGALATMSPRLWGLLAPRLLFWPSFLLLMCVIILMAGHSVSSRCCPWLSLPLVSKEKNMHSCGPFEAVTLVHVALVLSSLMLRRGGPAKVSE